MVLRRPFIFASSPAITSGATPGISMVMLSNTTSTSVPPPLAGPLTVCVKGMRMNIRCLPIAASGPDSMLTCVRCSSA